MPTDDLERWLEDVDEGSPLMDAVASEIERLPVDDGELDGVVARVQARMRRRAWRRRMVVPVGVATAAAVVVALVVTWSGPSEPSLVATWEVPPPPPEAQRVAPVEGVDPGEEAARWLEDGSVQDAVLRYRWLLAERPTDPEAAIWQLGLYAALKADGDVDSAVTAAMDLVERYGPGTAWSDRYGTAELTARMGKAVGGAALLAHMTGRKTGDEAMLDRAGVAYELYLSDVADPERESEVRYAYGELLYQRGRFDEAWEQYLVVARDPDSARAKFCAESAVFAADRMQAEADDSGRWRDRLVETLDVYVDRWPDDEKALGMRYKAAYVVYEDDPVAALDRLEGLAEEAPASVEGGRAAHLALDARVIDGDFEGAAAWAARFLAEADLPDVLRQEISEIGARAAHKATEAAVARGAEPTEAWAAYAAAWPEGPEPPKPRGW